MMSVMLRAHVYEAHGAVGLIRFRFHLQASFLFGFWFAHLEHRLMLLSNWWKGWFFVLLYSCSLSFFERTYMVISNQLVNFIIDFSKSHLMHHFWACVLFLTLYFWHLETGTDFFQLVAPRRWMNTWLQSLKWIEKFWGAWLGWKMM